MYSLSIVNFLNVINDFFFFVLEHHVEFETKLEIILGTDFPNKTVLEYHVESLLLIVLSF